MNRQLIGEAFVRHARKTLDLARAAILRTQAIGKGEPQEFLITYSRIISAVLEIQHYSAVAKCVSAKKSIHSRESSTEILNSSSPQSCADHTIASASGW